MQCGGALSPGRVAAVDRQQRPGHEARSIGGDERHRSRDLLWSSYTAEGDGTAQAGHQGVVFLASAPRHQHVGFGIARTDRIDPDAVGRMIDRHGTGQLRDRALAGAWLYRRLDLSRLGAGLRTSAAAIIGTGATAVQCVPHLGEWAKELYVFQRTPSSIDVRNNRPTDPDWAKRLEPGWQQRRMDNFNILVSGGFADEDLVNDGWTDIIGKLLVRMRQSDGTGSSPGGLAATIALADFDKVIAAGAKAMGGPGTMLTVTGAGPPGTTWTTPSISG